VNAPAAQNARPWKSSRGSIGATAVRTRAAAGAALLLLALAAAAWLLSPPRDLRPVALDAATHRIDPNRASRAELMALPGVGPVLADSIIAYRASSARQPAYCSADDLDAVPRIGPKTVARLRPFLKFDSTTSDAAPLSSSASPAPNSRDAAR
jgi:hypothetical protein